MKEKKPAKKIKQLSVGASASGAQLLTDCKDRWWEIPAKNAPVDRERLEEDCKSILNGVFRTSYLRYIGKLNVDFDDDNMLLGGWMPFGYYHSSLFEIHLDLRLAGPRNLLLFGEGDRIAELPEAVIRVHSETTRIYRKMIARAKKERRALNNLESEFYRLVIDIIAWVRYWAFIDELDDLPEWFNNDIWTILAQMSSLVYKESPVSALPLYIAAYELDGVCLPVPDEIIDDFKIDANGDLGFSLQQSWAHDDAWAKADCQPPALLESLQHFYSDWVDQNE